MLTRLPASIYSGKRNLKAGVQGAEEAPWPVRQDLLVEQLVFAVSK